MQATCPGRIAASKSVALTLPRSQPRLVAGRARRGQLGRGEDADVAHGLSIGRSSDIYIGRTLDFAGS
jgi:hypothetical protein